MRVACTQSLRGSGSLCAELNAPLYLNENIELLKKPKNELRRTCLKRSSLPSILPFIPLSRWLFQARVC